jgi:hypothetical protein
LDVHVVDREHETWGPLQEALFDCVADGGYNVSGIMSYAGADDGRRIVFRDRNPDLFEKDRSALDWFGTEGTLEGGELEACLDAIFEDAGGKG